MSGTHDGTPRSLPTIGVVLGLLGATITVSVAAGIPSGTVGTWELDSKVTPADAHEPGPSGKSHAFTSFGSSLAVDGDTLVVGTAFDRCDLATWAYVFERGDAGGWHQTAKLVPEDGSHAGANSSESCSSFGAAVDVDDDAGVIVVGNPAYDLEGEEDAGSAYVFERSSEGAWEETAKFTGPDRWDQDQSFGPFFGESVTVDGSTVAVAAPGDKLRSGDEDAHGSAFVYEDRDPQGWTKTSNLTAQPPIDDDVFGFSMGLDEDTLVVGAGDGDKAYVFERSGPAFSQEAVLEPPSLHPQSEQIHTCFGFDVDVDAGTVVVGSLCWPPVAYLDAGPVAYGKSERIGGAFVFEEGPDGWQMETQLHAGDSLDGDLGNAVGVSGDRIVVGARASPAGSIGSAYVFEQTADRWIETGRLRGPDTNPCPQAFCDRFGHSVAIDAGTVVAGAPFDDNRRDGTPFPLDDEGDLPPVACGVLGCSGVDEGENAGSVYVFRPAEEAPSKETPGAGTG